MSSTIEWTAVEGLLIAAGARVIEGRESRVRFEKDGKVETFHLGWVGSRRIFKAALGISVNGTKPACARLRGLRRRPRRRR